MDELSMFRAVRPQDAYADERREAARDRLLAEATGSAPAGRRALRSTRAVRRISRPWQAGLAAALAIGVTAAVAGTYHAGGGAYTPGTHAPGAEATASGAARVLLLAAGAAQQSAPPPGAHWLVWGDQTVSTASAQKMCGGTAKSVTAQAYAKLRSLASCQAQPPASLPELRHARTVSGDGYPDLGPLPDQPAALLRTVERWYAAYYKKNADTLPGHPAPPLTRPGLYAGAFDVLRVLLESGVTSPSPAVQLRALALIPGTKVVTGARNSAGQPGIAVTITSPDPAQTGFSQEEIIFDSRTYQDIGGVLVQPDQYATGGSVTISTTRTWQAYYNAAGHRL
jgi:hypothetical protein